MVVIQGHLICYVAVMDARVHTLTLEIEPLTDIPYKHSIHTHVYLFGVYPFPIECRQIKPMSHFYHLDTTNVYNVFAGTKAEISP